MATAETTTTATREADLEFRATLDRLTTLIVFFALVMVILMYGLAPYLALRWVQRPFVGGYLEPTLLVNGAGPRDDPAWAINSSSYNIAYPDRLLEVEGVPIHTNEDLARILASHSFGDTVEVTIELATGQSLNPSGVTVNGIVTLPVRLIMFPIGELWNAFFVPYFVGLAFLLIGLWVFRMRHHEPAGRIFALFCGSTAVMLGGFFDLYTTHVFASLWSLAVPLTGAGLFTLSVVFPHEAEFVAQRPVLRIVAFAPGLLLGGFAVWAVNNLASPYIYATAWLLGFLYSAASALVFFAVTLYWQLRGNSPIVRSQSGITLLGSLGFLPIAIWAILTAVRPEYHFQPIFFVPMVLFPLGIAYAILRYRLLDTEVLLRRTLVYSMLGIFTGAGYWLLVYGASVISGTAVRADSPFIIGLMVLVLVIAFNPVRNWLQTRIDLLFFRGTQAYRAQLQAFGRALTESTDLPYIAGQLRQQIEGTLKPSHLHLFLRDPGRGEYSAYAPTGRPDTDLRFLADGALARQLGSDRRALYLAPDTLLPSSLIRDRARIAVLGSRLFIPLNSKTGLIGWLALGNRLLGQPYTPQDLEYLETLADQSALAIERALAFDTLEKRVNELNVLSQVSQAINFSISFDDLLELIYAQAGRVLDVRNFSIIMHEPATDALRYAFFVESDERDASREDKPWPFGQGLASEVVRTGQPIITDDYLSECSRRRLTPLNRPYRAWMGAPLNGSSGTLGAMTIASTDASRTFTNDELKILTAIADQAATAIEKARLYGQTAERARQLATLNQVAQTITSTLDLDALLQSILESAVDILGCEAGSLFLIDEETSDSVLRVAVGSVAKDIIGIRVPAGRGIVGSAAESGQPVIVNDTASDPRWFQKPDQTTGFVSRTVMAVPLRIKDRNIGVLEVINKRSGQPFNDEDTSVLTAFAGQAAVAIENARLFNLTDQALAARVEELSAMQRIDRELNAALDVNRVMAVILERALATTEANAGFAGLVGPDGIQIIASKGYNDAIRPFLEAPLPADKGLIGIALGSKSTSYVRDVRNHPDYIQMLPDTISQLIVPIVREDVPIGVLMIESREPERFTDDHVSFLARLADHGVIAITNARLYGEVNAANQAKTEFVSLVSHELKNPMQSIKGYTQLIRTGAAGPVNDGQQHFLNIVEGNVERMITIVSDLTDIARIESGRLQLNIRPMQFQTVLDEVARSMQAAYDSKAQALSVETEPNLPPVLGDSVRLTQILTNLVSNAHKYSPNGAVVTIRARQEENRWDPLGGPEVLHVSVQDSGYGISPEDQQRLFTKFFRADNNKSDAPGTGLGLNIVKQMVELGGGKVWFESELGKGSTFHFTVPLANSMSLGTRPLRPLPTL